MGKASVEIFMSLTVTKTIKVEGKIENEDDAIELAKNEAEKELEEIMNKRDWSIDSGPYLDDGNVSDEEFDEEEEEDSE